MLLPSRVSWVSMLALLCMLLSLPSLTMAGGEFLKVRETDSDVLYLHVPVPEAQLRHYLSPKLDLDLYNGTAWMNVMVFNIDKLESQVFGHWTPLPTGGGLCVKVSTYVRSADGGKPGYLLMSLDFAKGMSGLVQKYGCKGTQKGVVCGILKAASHKLKSGVSDLKAEDKCYVDAKYAVDAPTAPVDRWFVKWAVDRVYKYEQEGKGASATVTAGIQAGRDSAENLKGRGVAVSEFHTNVAESRFQLSPLVPNKVCGPFNSACFVTDTLKFIDGNGVPV